MNYCSGRFRSAGQVMWEVPGKVVSRGIRCGSQESGMARNRFLSRLKSHVRGGATSYWNSRSYDGRRRRTRAPGPLAVQIQTIDICNASCIMCPYSPAARSGPPNRMGAALYTRILEELRRAGTLRFLFIVLQNEPLMDRRLPDRIREARRVFGRELHIGTVTNGSLLTDARIDELVTAGLDRLTVSIDAYQEETFKKIRKGMDFGRVVQNTKSALKRRGDMELRVRMVTQRANRGEAGDFVRQWEALGAFVECKGMANRIGGVADFGELRMPTVETRRIWVRDLVGRLERSVDRRLVPQCAMPFRSMSILWDGRVILCCNDWGPAQVMGNLSSQSLADVWNGEAMNHHRYLLWKHRGHQSHICAGCSKILG